MNRRSVLSGVAGAVTIGVAGCLGSAPTTTSEQYHLELTVQNDHDRAYDIRVVLTDADDRAVFEQSFRLGPGEGRGFGDDVSAGEYTLVVELPDRSELRSYWNTDQCDVHRVRTHIARDGHVSHHVACQSADGDPRPMGQGPATPRG